jgi:class III poly(R)-hydroxyalkanoic acid synthase PhaE subunit
MSDTNPWTAGAEAVMKSFSEAQKQLWESWAQFAASGKPQHYPFVTNPFEQSETPFGRALEEWQRLTQESLRNVRWDDSFMRGVAERMVGGQNSVMQLISHAASAWQAMLKQQTMEGWQETLRDYSQKLQQSLLSAPPTLSQDVSELWALYLREIQKLAQLWYTPSLDMSKLAADGRPSEVSKLIDHFWSAYDKTLGRALSSPTMGYNREFNAKILQGFEAWLELRRADLSYQALVAEIFTKAFDAMMRQMVERAQNGGVPQHAKDLINLWIATADEVFVEEFGQQGYIEAQGRLLNATMRYKVRERAILESFLDAYGLPTRSELDETHQTIYELRREVKALKREVRELRQASNRPAAAEPPRPQDDLTQIKGVGPKLAERLHAEGITSLKQIAELTDDEIARLDEKIAVLRGRIIREDWRAQASALLG